MEVTGVVASVPTMDGLGKSNEQLVDGGWQLENWRYCWGLVGLMWTEVWEPDLSTISQCQGRRHGKGRWSR